MFLHTTSFYLSIVCWKFFHTRCRALRPELILVYKQSAHGWLSHPPSDRLLLLSARPAVTSVVFTWWCHLYMAAHSDSSLLLIYRPWKDERSGWLTGSGRFIHNSGHPSAAGRVQDRKFTSQRSTFYHCAMQPTCLMLLSPKTVSFRAGLLQNTNITNPMLEMNPSSQRSQKKMSIFSRKPSIQPGSVASFSPYRSVASRIFPGCEVHTHRQ